MKNWKPLLVYLVTFVAFVLIDRFILPHPVVKTLAMVSMVLFVAALIRGLLSFLKPRSARA